MDGWQNTKNDNTIPLSYGGIAFYGGLPITWSLVSLEGLGIVGGINAELQENVVAGRKWTGYFTYSTAVPEPLTILGATTAIGFGAKFKKRLNQVKKSKKDVA